MSDGLMTFESELFIKMVASIERVWRHRDYTEPATGVGKVKYFCYSCSRPARRDAYFSQILTAWTGFPPKNCGNDKLWQVQPLYIVWVPIKKSNDPKIATPYCFHGQVAFNERKRLIRFANFI